MWPIKMLFALVSFIFIFSSSAVAQMASAGASMWGSGMWGGAQNCGYQIQIGDEAQSIQDDMDELEDSKKELRLELRELEKEQRTLKRELKKSKDQFKRYGFQGTAFSFLDSHITAQRSCDAYDYYNCNSSRNGGVGIVLPSSTPNRSPAGNDNNDIKEHCNANGNGGFDNAKECYQTCTSNPDHPNCGPQPPRVTNPVERPYPNPPNYQEGSEDQENESGNGGGGRPIGPPSSGGNDGSSDDCSGLVPIEGFSSRDWRQACGDKPGHVKPIICQSRSAHKDHGKSFDVGRCEGHLADWIDQSDRSIEVDQKIKELKAQIKDIDLDLKALKKDKKIAIKDYQREVREEMTEGGCVGCMIQAGNVYAPQRPSGWEVAGNVALGIGSMYFGNELNKYQTDQNAKLGFPTQSYSAIGYGMPYFANALSGAIGGGTSGGAFGCGNTGIGAQGGIFGYPGQTGMNPYGMGGMNGMGGMGMNPYGMNPYGMGGGIGGGIGMNPYGMGGMNGMGGMGMNPYGMNPYGMGGGIGGGIGMNPYGMGGMNGMGMNPYGMNPYGMGGGIGGGICMNPYGMGGMNGMGGMGMNPYGMNPYGMGGMDMQAQMQMQQLQMQMQMQQYEQAMKHQQQQYQQYTARQQTVTALQQELATLMYRLQQAQMGTYTGGYLSNSPVTNYPTTGTLPYSPAPGGSGATTPGGAPRYR